MWVGFVHSDLSQLRVELGKSFAWKSQEPQVSTGLHGCLAVQF